MDHDELRDQLLAAGARLAAHRRQLADARTQVVDRAREQYTSGQRAQLAATSAMDRGSEAGVLGARYIRARHHENERLRAVLMDDPLDDGDAA